jgi:hypothetical protein
MRGAFVWALIVFSSPSPAAAFDHVRSDQAVIRAWIAEGYSQSATFKALVDEVEGLPGIVYIDATVAVPRGLDGALLHRVVGSRDLPILRVQLRWNLSTAEGIATMAHELQHVAEVLRVGQALDSSRMSALFAAIDTAHDAGSSRFETEEARQVTTRVRDELGRRRQR